MTTATITVSSDSTPAGMEELSRTFGASLFGYLLRYARGRRSVAEDMLQETMLRAWRRFDSVPDSHDSRRRWLFAIARNVAIDADRARRVRPQEYGGLDLSLLPADNAGPERALTAHIVREALARLSPSHRDVLMELYFADRTLVEAAERLGIPEGTVKSRCHYALKVLRSALDIDGGL